MNLSEKDFHQLIVSKKYRKNNQFKADRANLQRIITYIKNMPVCDESFEIVQYLIKEFGITILACFQPFYQKIVIDESVKQKYKQKLQRVSALAAWTFKPLRCPQLIFFRCSGTAKKGFTVKQKTPQQLEFIDALEHIKRCMIAIKQQQQISNHDIQKLNQISQKMNNKKFNPFACYYLQNMRNKLYAAQNETKRQLISSKNQRKIDEAKNNHMPSYPINYFSKKQNQSLQDTQASRHNISKEFNDSSSIIEYSLDRSNQFSSYDDSIDRTRDRSVIEKNQKSQILSFSAIHQNSKIQYQDEDQNQLNTSKQKLNNSDNISFQLFGPNFAKIPLCCRTYFFDLERILPGQDKRTQYKSYRFPFNPVSIQTFKKTICAFLNTLGGQIYIGIKQTTNKKYRYVLGNYFTENDKEEVLKSFRKITQAIYPNITHSLDVDFVPVRKSPFQDIYEIGHTETYFYDFSKKSFDLHKCPFKPAFYVIRVRVPMGNKDSMYSYIQTDYQLNKSSNSNQFIPFRSQNEVLVKQISQQVLKKYKQRLLYGQQNAYKTHKHPCPKPQHGQPRNQPQPEEQIRDAKQIEAILCQTQTNMKKKKIQTDKFQSTTKISPQAHKNYHGKQTKETIQPQKPIRKVNQKELDYIFKYPLSFICLRISKQRLKKCIDKTPAKDYTTIQWGVNQLSKDEELLIIKVNGYPHMQQFLKIKAKLQTHFLKENVQLVGISKRIQLESNQNRRIMETLLTKNNHKYAVYNRTIQFFSLFIAAAYFMNMKHLGFRVQAIPD